jgi:hypothetical protein
MGTTTSLQPTFAHSEHLFSNPIILWQKAVLQTHDCEQQRLMPAAVIWPITQTFSFCVLDLQEGSCYDEGDVGVEAAE